jgi:2-polyprenyl-3-methyl-5-hydroxy-6-metoxy-1,4-benzoquinol methylase
LRYYVLTAARRRRRTPAGILREIEKESGENREFRSSGQLVVDEDELARVLRQLARQKLITRSGQAWGLTRDGRCRLGRYDREKEKSRDSKDRAARALLRWMDPRRPGRVLDVGTGHGYLAFQLAEKGYRVLGIDSASFEYSKDSIRKAQEEAEGKGLPVEFRKLSVAGLRRKHARFDHVVASQAVHCMQDQPRCIKAIFGLLKPGGAFLCMDLRVGRKGFLEHGWHTFLSLSEEEWSELLPDCGFEEPAFRRRSGYLVVKARRSPS